MPKRIDGRFRSVTTAVLLELEFDARDSGLNQRLDPDWLAARIAPDGRHHLLPALEHVLAHRPEISPQVRCELLLHMGDGARALSLLDVRPALFDRLPPVVDPAAHRDLAEALRRARPVREWRKPTDPGRPPFLAEE
ncbi:hypothetical protein HDA32_005979 [Spinactinospora alkalitolerans]|uniref:Uncharacterized protein n=1 Tax=Spinactinospora alkalitolerans TaxID=687207 RepID=A0A852U3U0_9ACTN|nr:hypothetical protein [Spinactinospora alkalitolerans]NYE50859.1 hypothetical protein [Spinactinospora alkalitolerans]